MGQFNWKLSNPIEKGSKSIEKGVNPIENQGPGVEKGSKLRIQGLIMEKGGRIGKIAKKGPKMGSGGSKMGSGGVQRGLDRGIEWG